MIVFESNPESEPPESRTPPLVASSPARPPAFTFRQMQAEIRELARRKPAQAVAAAFGVGLLVHLIPTRVVFGTVTALGALLVRPVLLSLGVSKALELCKNIQTTPTRP